MRKGRRGRIGLHPEDRERADAAVQQALDPAGSGLFSIEYRTVGIDDGEERWIAARGRSVFENDQPVRFIGTTLDITARKRADFALSRSEAKLREQAQTLETLNLKSSPAGPAPDFVERTRPDPAGLGFIPPALPHKVSQRPVKSPDDVKAATAALDAAKQRQLAPGGPAPVQLAKGRKAAKPKTAAGVAD